MADWQIALLGILMAIPTLGGWLFWGYRYTQKKRAAEARTNAVARPSTPKPPSPTNYQASPLRTVQSSQIMPAAELAQPSEPTIMPMNKLAQSLVKAPHLFIVGNSGSGKSVFLSALIKYFSNLTKGTKVCVLSTHTAKNVIDGREYAAFAGLPVAKSLDDIIRMGKLVLDELDYRIALDELDNLQDREPLLVVIDEVSSIIDSADDKAKGELAASIIRSIIIKLSNQARKYRIKLIIGSQERTGGALGTSGRTKVLDNFVHVRLGQFATSELAQSLDYPAEIDVLGKPQAINTSEWLGFAMTTIATDNCWHMELMQALENERKRQAMAVINAKKVSSVIDLEQLIMGDTVLSTQATDMPILPVFQADNGMILENDTNEDTDSDLDQIVKMLDSGMSGNQIITALGGNRNKRVAQIKQARMMLAQSQPQAA